MKIKHRFVGMLTGETQEIVASDQVSPNSGYTQAYADRQGKSYEDGRAEELFGGDDFWQWLDSTYLSAARGTGNVC